MDDEDRSLSILDEHEAKEVIQLLTKDAIVSGQIWGDIYRNSFLSSVRNPPIDLTPDGPINAGGHNLDQAIHQSIKIEQLRDSRLWKQFKQPLASDRSGDKRQHYSMAASFGSSAHEEEVKGPAQNGIGLELAALGQAQAMVLPQVGRFRSLAIQLNQQ